MVWKVSEREIKRMQIAKGGLSWIGAAIAAFVIFSILAVLTEDSLQKLFVFFSILSGLISILFLVFFRDPNRTIGKGIVAVADGIIRDVAEIEDDEIGNAWFISTFMNIYHVHVNRMPVDGIVKKVEHHPGSHLPAFTKESERNERVTLLIETQLGLVKIVLIAGTLARRIVPYAKEGDNIRKGEKISLIRLGSRVDVYLPKKMKLTVHVTKKDHVKAGGSMLAASND
jgi:phosphatidylserine decarboxylase